MYFTKALLLGASFAVAALAQGISITQYPSGGAVASQPTVIGWSGGDGSSVITITLKQGGNVLSTILQRNGQASTFTWTPSDALTDASNYVLEITQGTTVYDTPSFSITGAQAASSSSSMTSPASTSSATTTVTIVGSSTSSTSTSTSTMSTLMTTTAPAMTASVVPPVYTNGTTVVTPVLTSTAMLSATTTGSATGSSTSPSVTPASAASGLTRSLVAVLSVFAAVVYLG
ncbi:Mucin-12 [Xylographa opegraphella]|nr:Mucin-12 [Xylographa opegraphella]